MRQFYVFSLLVMAIFGVWSYAFAGTPLDVRMDPTAFGVTQTLTCLGLTELFKNKVSALKSNPKWCPWVSLGLGVLGATVNGFGSGMNIGQVLQGVLFGGMASYSYDLLGSVGAGLRALGVRPKTPPAPAGN